MAEVSPSLSMVFTSGTESFRSERPKNRRPKPMRVSPMWRQRSLPVKNIGKPTPIIGSAMADTLNLPMRATSQAVMVVPMLAPMMTPMDSTRVSRPALTKLTTRTVVAEED